MAELDARLSAAELLEWQRFDAEWPFADRRADWHFATLTAALLNALTKREDGLPWRATDLLLFRDPVKHDRRDVAQQVMQVVAAVKERMQGER